MYAKKQNQDIFTNLLTENGVGSDGAPANGTKTTNNKKKVKRKYKTLSEGPRRIYKSTLLTPSRCRPVHEFSRTTMATEKTCCTVCAGFVRWFM